MSAATSIAGGSAKWFNRMRTSLVLSLLALAVPHQLPGQAVPRRPTQKVTLDLSSLLRYVDIPFEEHFLLEVPVLKGTKAIDLEVVPEVGSKISKFSSHFWPDTRLEKQTAQFVILELPPNKNFGITLRYWFVEEADRKMEDCKPLTVSRRSSTCVEETFTARTRAPLATHFDSDFGLLFSEGPGYSGLGLQVHFHFKPINKNTPRFLTDGDFLRAFSLVGGLSILEFASDGPVKKPNDVGFPVAGAALRLVEPIRVMAGWFFYEEDDPESDDENGGVKNDWFVGIAVDFALQEILGSVGDRLGIK